MSEAEHPTIYDMAVLGGGPGGYTAALYAARAGLSVVVLEKTAPGGQMAATGVIDNYPGFDEGVEGFALARKMQAGAERFGAKTVWAGAAAADLAASPKRITLERGAGGYGSEILARTVVLATGATPRRLGLPEEEALAGRGVSWCAVCDGMFYRDKTVVVVGGGNSAADDALYLARLCKKVYLVHRRGRLRAAPALEKALQESGVEILWNRRVVEILHEQTVTGVRLASTLPGVGPDAGPGAVDQNGPGAVDQNRPSAGPDAPQNAAVPAAAGETIPCDGVFVAVGRLPDTGLFAGQLAMDEQGYLIADETTRTALPGVYAVGDARQKPLRQIVTAAADGACAAYFASEYLREEA